jgi:hypothetical protein
MDSKFSFWENVWMIDDLVKDPSIEFFLRIFPPNESETVQKLAVPSKHSLLHRLIEVETVTACREIAGSYGLEELEDHLDKILPGSYNRKFLKQDLIKWYQSPSLQAHDFRKSDLMSTMLPLSNWTDRIFAVLFSDRDFIFRFSNLLTHVVSEVDTSKYPKWFDNNGRIRRVRWPKWLEKGLFLRDKGHCANCGADVSNLYRRSVFNIDHLIPLAQDGCNDPSNLQLLCEKCNLSKGSRIQKNQEQDFKLW